MKALEELLGNVDWGIKPKSRRGERVTNETFTQFKRNIVQWMRYKGIKPYGGSKGSDYMDAAYHIAKKIINRGTAGVQLTEYIENTYLEKIRKDVADAYRREFVEEINITIGQINKRNR